MYNDIDALSDEIPVCPNLTSLLINDNPSLRKPIPESFFRCMPILRVLDLSYTGIEELPKSIGLLVELQYLNLSSTNIYSLPEEMGNLQKLRNLGLCKTKRLWTLPRQEILKLTTLQCLDLSYSNYIWDASDDIADGISSDQGMIVSVETTADLEALNQLEDLGLTIATTHFLRVLLSSHSLSNAMNHLSLEVQDLSVSDLSTVSESMKRLSCLRIIKARGLKELIFSNGQFLKLDTLRLFDLPMLRRIVLNKEAGAERGQTHEQILPRLTDLVTGKCHLRDFSWVLELSTLTNIDLHNCNGLEELMLDKGDEGDDENDSLNCSLPNLKSLILGWLPNLRCISRRPLLLPSLAFIFVYGCPKLKSLPFGLGSAKKVKTIKGSQRWWDRLVWTHQL